MTKLILSAEDKEYYKKIRSHLGKLHAAWQEDGCPYPGKIGEGYVSLEFSGGDWADNNWDKETYVNSDLKIVRVNIDSYLFGPSRSHSYESMKEAWKEVSKWGYSNPEECE